MIRTRLLPTLTLFAITVAGCAPRAVSTNPPAATTQPPTVLVPTPSLAAPTVETATEAASGESTALPIATSRGPNLEATDPTTVSMASGGLQFVEFFEFW
jgi:hypothetical protein